MDAPACLRLHRRRFGIRVAGERSQNRTALYRTVRYESGCGKTSGRPYFGTSKAKFGLARPGKIKRGRNIGRRRRDLDQRLPQSQSPIRQVAVQRNSRLRWFSVGGAEETEWRDSLVIPGDTRSGVRGCLEGPREANCKTSS